MDARRADAHTHGAAWEATATATGDVASDRTTPRSWVVALGLREGGSGPLAVGAWLRRATDADLSVVHVARLPSSEVLRDEDLRSSIIHELDRVVAHAGPSVRAPAPELIVADDVRLGLIRRATVLGAGLVIGRSADRDDPGIVRLGRVARRVLRDPPGPVAIVPRDLTRADLGPGPILVAIAARDDSVGAARFALDLARRSGRALVVATVMDSDQDWSPDQTSLEAFLARHRLGDRRVVRRRGHVVEQLLDVCAVERPCCVVCGSRKLSLAQRIVGTSVGSNLAALADEVAFIVPP